MEPKQRDSEQDNFDSLKKVTPLSKYLAMILFITLPFVGGWIGYTYAPEKVVEVDRVTFNSAHTREVVTQPVGNIQASAKSPNYCVRLDRNEEDNLFTNIKNQLIENHPEQDFTKLVRMGYECLLENGQYLGMVPFFDESDIEKPFGLYFVEYDQTGVINDVSSEYGVATGDFYISEINSEKVNFISEAVDPCYLAYHVYRYNLDTNELSTQMYGGDQGQACWDKLNASGGV